MTGRSLLIGVGHRDRGDDGIGPAIADEIDRRGLPVTTIVREGELADLMLEWAGDDHVVIVDACASGAPLGTVQPLELEDAQREEIGSTHGLGVPFAIELARRLGRLPADLTVVGVEGRRFGLDEMSPDLAARVGAITDEVCQIARLPT